MAVLRLRPDLEEGLRELPGIRAASVVTGPDATPREVHVVSSRGKPAKQIVRDVQSLALARFGVEVDHRTVSVVLLDPEDGPDAAEPSRRPALAALATRVVGTEAEATVSLTGFGGESFTGTHVGPASVAHRPRLVAEATLEALRDLLGVDVAVETAALLPVGGRTVAVVVLTLAEPRLGDQVLSGCAPVRNDDGVAVARAVLAALNRRLTA